MVKGLKRSHCEGSTLVGYVPLRKNQCSLGCPEFGFETLAMYEGFGV
jgi:hypothetical protein